MLLALEQPHWEFPALMPISGGDKVGIKEEQGGEQEQLSASSVCNGRCCALETRRAQSSTERVISRAHSTSGTHISQARFWRLMLTKNVRSKCNNFFQKSIFYFIF